MIPTEGGSSRWRVGTWAVLFTVTLSLALVAVSADGAGARPTLKSPAPMSGVPLPIESADTTPIADFIARQDRMDSAFDASASYSPVLRSIVSYDWDFGDGSTGTGVQVTHPYATPGRYRVNLTVADDQGASGSTERFVSPADTTVDILLDQFFTAGCPYNNYWFLRYATYGDRILRNSVPCTEYYPWVLITDDQPHNPSYVDTLYRWDARVRNFPGYDLNEPVILPVLNSSVQPNPSSYIQFNLTFDYLNSSMFQYYANTSYPVNDGLSDGFGYLVRGTLTMDLTMSKRIFGVVANTIQQARDWWGTHTTTGGINSGVETQFAAWLESQGNGKYDIYNAFEWYYMTDITDLNAIVDADGTTHVSVFWDGWGYEVLLSRFFYWGSASYRDAVCVHDPANPSDPCPATRNYGDIQPKGWMPMESCWCERGRLNGTIRSSLDLDWDAIQGYHFKAWANWGRDGVPGTADDLASWVWAPFLMDYVPRVGLGSSGYPNSELRWYEGLSSVHGTPGSYAYGDAYEYLMPPTRWRLDAGSSLTLVLPTFDLTWYDPVQSMWNPITGVGDYVTFDSPITLRLIRPSGTYFIWDQRAKVLSIAGPYDWGWTSLPVEPAPWIEFGPAASGTDYDPPTTAASTSGESGSAGWFRSDVVVTLLATDVGGGVAVTWYTVDGGFYRTYAGPFVVSGDGTHTVSYYSTDYANNSEDPKQLAIQVDTTAPVLLGLRPSGTLGGSDVSFTWFGSDSTSGIVRYEVSLDGQPFRLLGLQTNMSVALADGTHSLHVRAIDAAGNSGEGSTTVFVDTNVFSPSGPYLGLPSYLIVAGIVLAAAVLFLRRRRGKLSNRHP